MTSWAPWPAPSPAWTRLPREPAPLSVVPRPPVLVRGCRQLGCADAWSARYTPAADRSSGKMDPWDFAFCLPEPGSCEAGGESLDGLSCLGLGNLMDICLGGFLCEPLSPLSSRRPSIVRNESGFTSSRRRTHTYLLVSR